MIQDGRNSEGASLRDHATHEEWRFFDDNYEVSDGGEVRRNGRRIKPYPRDGYHRVCLSNNGLSKHVPVHRMVAEAFIGPRPDGKHVCHLNGVRTDNRLANLAYKTRVENEADKFVHGTSLHGERNHKAKLKEQDIPTIRLRILSGERFPSIAFDYGVSPHTIKKIRTGETWKHI